VNGRLSAWLEGGDFIKFKGHQIFMRQGGSGPPLLLVHGYPTSSYDWHAVWDTLSKHYSLIALDMLGLGFSDKPRQHAYSLLEQADLHEALLRHRGLRSVLVMAHDMGVSVVQEMLARRMLTNGLPDIKAVVFLNGGVIPELYQPQFIQRVLSSPLLYQVRPIRLINGPDDPNSGQHMADGYRQRVPGADIVSLPGTGHWPQIESPEEVSLHALDFLQRH
jgi:pimeloyl-ACP methyl ester carboxylesterase